jgi:two-component system chemotaxis response regulator CheY
MRHEEVQILIIDDVNSMKVQLKDLLRLFGFRHMMIASNGEEAKAIMEKQAFHLVLSDWHMEPTSGVELLKWVRSKPKFNDTAFIMVTAESTKESVVQAIQLGVDDYLIKPLTILQVQNKVYAVLFKRKILS